MKLAILLTFTLILVVTSHTSMASSIETKDTRKNFLTQLLGHWHGELPDGKSIDITYEKLNGGAILERYRSQDPMWWNMSTVYVSEEGKITMNHYCSWGNHPRMHSLFDHQASKPNSLEFSFIDLHQTQADNGYMRTLTMTLEGHDTLYHHWVWREGDDSTPLTVKLERVSKS